MPNHETDRRAQWANALWEAAEHHTIAEWICCDPIDPKHGLCVAGGKALEMLRALIVDDPEAYKPAPLTTAALELAAAVSVPPPAPRADDQAAAERLVRVHEWVTSEAVTAKTEFGDGYRAAQRDIRDLIKGRFDADAVNELRRAAAPGPCVAGEQQNETPEAEAQQQPIPCNASHLRVHHAPHGWEPQPGMEPIPCPGYPQPSKEA